MKLNNEKNILLCSKALYAEQLKAYANLCKLYEALSKNASRTATASQIQERYSEALSLAAKGDLSFTERENNYIFSESFKGAKFNQSEIKIFKDYAKYSKILKKFKQASEIISSAVSYDNDGSPSVSEKGVNEYKAYMHESSVTRAFDKRFTEHSPTYIGHQYYLASRNSINAIQSIDSSHLQGMTISKKLSPSQFGATISGTTTINKLIEETTKDARHVDTRQERLEYSQAPNAVAEVGYRFFAKNQKRIAISLAAILATGAAAGFVSTVQTSHEYNKLSIDTLAENGYNNDLSQETLSKITDLENAIKQAQEQGQIPSSEQLLDIGYSLDDLFDDILEEKLSPSFLEAHPEAKDISIDHYYNYEDGENPYKSVTISYKDAEDKEQSENITRFGSEGLFSRNDLEKLFDEEYSIDNSYDEISNLFYGKNYIDNSKDAKGVLKDYSNKLKFMKHFAALHLHYKDGLVFGIGSSSIRSEVPEKGHNDNTYGLQKADSSIQEDNKELDSGELEI